jgi:hypothetical protein
VEEDEEVACGENGENQPAVTKGLVVVFRDLGSSSRKEVIVLCLSAALPG